MKKTKQFFLKKILDAQHGPTRKLYSRDRINEIIKIIKENKDLKNVKKDSTVYYLLDNFKIYKICQQEHLIAANEEIKHIAANEDLYDIILEAHKIVGHGGIKKSAKQLKQKYHNITEKSLKILKVCVEVAQKHTPKKGAKNVIVKPIKSTGFGQRGQLDLIDLRSLPN